MLYIFSYSSLLSMTLAIFTNLHEYQNRIKYRHFFLGNVICYGYNMEHFYNGWNFKTLTRLISVENEKVS